VVGSRLRTARLAQMPPCSLEEFSALLEEQAGLELTAATLSKIERGLRSVYDFEILAFCSTLKIDSNELLGLSKT